MDESKMAQKLLTGKYACSICEKQYDSPAPADACRDSHEIVYIPMTRTELNRLINGLHLEDYRMIPESLFKTLRKYQRIHGK